MCDDLEAFDKKPNPKKADKLESDIELSACKYAKNLGMLVYKLKTPQQRGAPDRMFIVGHVLFFIEFKRVYKGKPTKPTKQQLKRHQELRDRGFTVEVVWSLDQAKVVFDNMHFLYG